MDFSGQASFTIQVRNICLNSAINYELYLLIQYLFSCKISTDGR